MRSKWFLLVLLSFILFADYMANNKPLFAVVDSEWYVPAFKQRLVWAGISDGPVGPEGIDWYETEYDFVLWPPIPYSPENLDLNNAQSVSPVDSQNVNSLFWRHWLGTDEMGRDVLAGMIHGARIAGLVGLVAMLIAGLIGILLGAVAGFFGDHEIRWSLFTIILLVIGLLLGAFYAFSVRWFVLVDSLSESFWLFLFHFIISIGFWATFVVAGYYAGIILNRFVNSKTYAIPLDIIILRLIEVFVSVPKILLIISLIAIAKPSLFLVMAVIGLTYWTAIARFTRAEILKIRTLNYVEAGKALGYTKQRILFQHILPNAMSPVITTLAFGMAGAILVESTLSFLGLGVAVDMVTWGSILASAKQSSMAWWLVIFPGLAIFGTIVVFNRLGDHFSKELDPRLKKY